MCMRALTYSNLSNKVDTHVCSLQITNKGFGNEVLRNSQDFLLTIYCQMTKKSKRAYKHVKLLEIIWSNALIC